MQFFILVPLALVILSLLVLVHEFGHFLAAKFIGVWPEEFGIGLPPKIWGKKIGETEYTINALPLGGFVRLHGETPGEKVTKPERAFKNKPKLQRAFVALAGIAMNLVFAWLCLSLILWLFGIQRVKVVDIAPNSPAAASEVQVGDIVTKVNDRDITNADTFRASVSEHPGETIILSVVRNNSEEKVHITTNTEYVEDMGFTGILYEPQEFKQLPILQRPVTYTVLGVKETGYWINKTIEGFLTLFGQIGRGHVPQGLAGPFGVTLTIAEILRYGVYNTLTFTAIISINLAIINLIPFPPLDGSRVLLLVIEAFVGRKHVEKYEAKILEAGMAVLLLLILIITISEIPKLISAGSIPNFVDSLFGQ